MNTQSKQVFHEGVPNRGDRESGGSENAGEKKAKRETVERKLVFPVGNLRTRSLIAFKNREYATATRKLSGNLDSFHWNAFLCRASVIPTSLPRPFFARSTPEKLRKLGDRVWPYSFVKNISFIGIGCVAFRTICNSTCDERGRIILAFESSDNVIPIQVSQRACETLFH